MGKEELYNRVAKIIQKPYFNDLSEMGFHDKKSHGQILSIVFGEPVYVGNHWDEVLRKKDNKSLYYETPEGYWEIYRWDKSGNNIYKGYSNGDYIKTTYNKYNKIISHEHLQDGRLSLYRYDDNGNQIYYENNGFWIVSEFDSMGKLIYQEKSNGEIYDIRSEKNITESVDRKQKFYDYIIKTMLDDTEYEIMEKNYGGSFTEKFVAISFPMYPWEEYSYKPWNIHTWLHFDGWMIGALDIDYVVNNFGVDENLAEIIFKKYIKELASEISEKMPF